MHHLRGREAVKVRAAGGRIRAHVLGVEQFPQFHVRQLLGQADSVQSVTGGTEDGTELGWALSEAFQMVLAVVENHPAVGVVDPVIDIVAELTFPDRFADDLRNSRGRGGD